MAEDQIPFEATQTVIIPVGTNSQATISRELHTGHNRSRIEYVVPKSLAGKDIVNDGDWQWEYDPGSHRAVRSRTKWHATKKQEAGSLGSRVMRSYRVKVDPAFTTFVGRKAYVLRLSPRIKDRHRQVWWIDQATSLVLKREVYDPAELLHSSSSFSSIRFLTPAETNRPVWKLPPRTNVVTRDESVPITSHSEAKRMIPAWTRVLKTLGKGFEFDCARIEKVNDTETAHIEYSDGLIGISLMQVPDRATVPAGDRPTRAVQIGSVRGSLTHQSRYAVLTWRIAETTFSLIADLPEETAIALARSLK